MIHICCKLLNLFPFITLYKTDFSFIVLPSFFVAYYTILSSRNAIFTRPSGDGNFFYAAFRVNVTSGGNYTFRSNSAVDTYGYLYTGSFSPSAPSTNLLIADDDSAGNSQFRLTTALQSTGTAILVVTTYSAGATGGVTVIVTGPSAVTFVPISTCTTILSNDNAVFIRPSGSGSFYYVAVRVNVASSGIYTFESNSVIDTYGCLYNSSFSPSAPNTNLLIADDDSAGNGQFRLTTAMQPTRTVIIVVTTYSTRVTGSVTVTVTGPSAATFVI